MYHFSTLNSNVFCSKIKKSKNRYNNYANGPIAQLVERPDVHREGQRRKYINSVYILRLNNGQYYLGSTSDLDKRLIEHNSGKTKGIRYKLPATLIFHQEFETIEQARQTEYKIKKMKSRKIIERIIEDGEIKIK